MEAIRIDVGLELVVDGSRGRCAAANKGRRTGQPTTSLLPQITRTPYPYTPVGTIRLRPSPTTFKFQFYLQAIATVLRVPGPVLSSRGVLLLVGRCLLFAYRPKT